jgi:hypothetical protein
MLFFVFKVMTTQTRARDIKALIDEFDSAGIITNTRKLPKGIRDNIMTKYYELYNQPLGLNTLYYFLRLHRRAHRALKTHSDESNKEV